MTRDTNPHPPATGTIRQWRRMQTRVLVSGALVLPATVSLAVWGPALDLAGLPADARSWAAGATLLGGLVLLLAQGLFLRPGAQLADRLAAPAPAPEASAPGPAADTAAALQQLTQERADAERHAARLRGQLVVLMDALPHGAAFSQNRRFELSNAAFRQQLGWTAGELHGRSPYEVFASVNRDDELGNALRVAFGHGLSHEAELDFCRRDGTRLRARLLGRQVEPGNTGAGTLWLLLPLAEAAAAAPASHTDRPAGTAQPPDTQPPADAAQPPETRQRDALTGLLSGAAFQARLSQWMQAAAAGQTACLLLIDLDRFKQINQAAGRAAGDGVLRRAAALLQAQVRDGDALARLEGDTFAMLLPGCAPALALAMGERLHAALGTLGVDHDGRRLGVGATVGVAELDRSESAAAAEGGAAAAWMGRAQAAWYEAKYGGQGAVRLAAPAAVLPSVVPQDVSHPAPQAATV